ncbi:hypothetical protein QW131_30350 [Roseibium salinum]|nr:hypothetical protein [Roseibium salinum]
MTRWHEQGWQPEQAEYEASVALFTSGKAAFQMNGVWEVPTMTDMEEKGNARLRMGRRSDPDAHGHHRNLGRLSRLRHPQGRRHERRKSAPPS